MWMERERKCLHMGLEQRGVGRWRAGDGEGATISSHEDAVERWGWWWGWGALGEKTQVGWGGRSQFLLGFVGLPSNSGIY